MRGPSFGGNLHVVGLVLILLLLAQGLFFGLDRIKLPSPMAQDSGNGKTSLTYLEKTLENVQEKLFVIPPGNGDWEKTIAGERRSFHHSHRSRAERHAALSLRREGSLHEQRGELRPALDSYQRALALFREIGDYSEEASVLQRVGSTYKQRGEFYSALESHRKALSLFREIGEHSGEVSVLNDIGDVYLRLGEFFRGLEAFRTAQEIASRMADRLAEARSLQGLGHTYAMLGEPENARDRYLEALKVSNEDPAFTASLLTNLADLAILRGEQAHVSRELLLALQIWRRLGDLRGEARTLLVLGNACAAKGDRTKALQTYDRVLALSSGDQWIEAQALHGMAVQSSLGEAPGRALALFEKALDLERRLGDRSAEASTLLAFARLERRLGRLDSALKRTEVALQRIEFLRGGAFGPELRSSYLASKHVFYEFYIDLLMEMARQRPDQDYSSRALEASERARARTLLDLLNEAHIDIRQGVDPSLLLQERRLTARIKAVEQQRRALALGLGDQERVDVGKEIRSLLMQHDDIQAEIRASSPRYARLTAPQPLTTREIQRSVPDRDTLLLEYSLGEERSFLWVISLDSMTSFELPGRREIETEAHKFYELLSHRNLLASSATAASAQRLGQMILGPARAQLSARRLAIVADGALQYVPFAALRVPGLSDGPLISQHEIVMLPSASVVAVQRRTARPVPSKTVAILADPVFSADDPRLSRKPSDLWPPHRPKPSFAASRSEQAKSLVLKRLRYSSEEADAIASLVSAGQRLEAIGLAANRDLFLSGELSEYRIVHFATHSLIDSDHPELSRIMLSTVDGSGKPRNGVLSLQDISNMPLKADLVVLSACRTALGEEVRGEGLVGLTRGFLNVGAKQVLAGLWDAHDVATAELMKRFYRAMLVKGLSPSSALREAQLSMWREPEWQAPYYWAGFVLQGDWRETRFHRPLAERMGL